MYNDELSLWNAQCEYPGTEPFLLDGWQQYQSANQVAECVREACPQGISRSSYSSFEQMSNEVLTSNQIALKGEKLEGNA